MASQNLFSHLLGLSMALYFTELNTKKLVTERLWWIKVALELGRSTRALKTQ